MTELSTYLAAVQGAPLNQRIGQVQSMRGLAVDANGPAVGLGELCEILIAPRQAAQQSSKARSVLAEVVGLKPGQITLMPYGSLEGVSVGCEVVALGARSDLGVGNGLLGRVIDCFGNPLDGREAPLVTERRALKAKPINPMMRSPVNRVLETGIRAVDGLLTLGQGQRVGIFAGSGVGKSTLLGLLARHVRMDSGGGAERGINVIALIGERGREVREFVEHQLGPGGLQRSVVVVATSDQPAPARLRAAYAALAIAEHFRDKGAHVMLTMDSITRFAMARREVGLSAGEPPTARGYTPSVFAELPELCERCGTGPNGGSITALLTVLVEGDDLNEPVSDSLRSILDGHIVLSRHLAHQGQYPAIDVLKSASRLMNALASAPERDLAKAAVHTLAVLERNRQMVDVGAYVEGGNPELDRALRLEPALKQWLRQEEGGIPRAQALHQLQGALGAGQ